VTSTPAWAIAGTPATTLVDRSNTLFTTERILIKSSGCGVTIRTDGGTGPSFFVSVCEEELRLQPQNDENFRLHAGLCDFKLRGFWVATPNRGWNSGVSPGDCAPVESHV
jgi:hypothetical protein